VRADGALEAVEEEQSRPACWRIESQHVDEVPIRRWPSFD